MVETFQLTDSNSIELFMFELKRIQLVQLDSKLFQNNDINFQPAKVDYQLVD